jgi:hypothetical protein
MRCSDLALVVIRLILNAHPYQLLIKHPKWGDWSFVGGHVEAHEKNDWACAAVRECDEELAPLKHGEDFMLLPLLDQPLRWGPSTSRSAGGVPTIYTAQLFSLRFLRDPAECLLRLPRADFRLVRESAISADTLVARVLGNVDRSAVAWEKSLSALPLPT